MRGYFITFEGGEGSGKTTLSSRIRDALKKLDKDVLLTREPGGTAFGEELRHLLLHYKGAEKIDPKAELFMFLASRIQHVEELIKPAIAKGTIVLCDRFSDSTIAYQGKGKDLGFDYVTSCCQIATGDFEPDLTFFVDVGSEIGLARVDKRAPGVPRDRMEKETEAFHQRVHAGYLELTKKFPKRIIRLDGTLDPDAVFESAYSHLKNFLTQ